MVQSVELLLDGAGETWVRAQWAALDDAGLPNAGSHGHPSHRPHLTLLAVRELSPEAEAALAEAVPPALPVAVRLGPPALFGRDPYVLVRLVLPGPDLLALQDVVRRAAPAAGLGGHFERGAWVPHLTLVRRLPGRLLGEALAAVTSYGERDGLATRARRWDGDRLREWPLGGAADPLGR